MRRGLVLGKFMPLHSGHIELIKFGRDHCDELIVWVCVSESELMPGNLRLKWISEVFEDDTHIKPVLFHYSENDLPNTSESSRGISEKWAEAIRENLPEIDIIFTAEPYGNFVAEYLDIEHKFYAGQKGVSASLIRRNPYKYWGSVPGPVHLFYFRKVAILGTESTGKTTLTKKLAQYFQSDFVSEVGRDIVDITEQCTWEDLDHIAREHARQIILKEKDVNKILFIDTDISITQSYARFLFNKELEVDDWILQANRCDIYLYLWNDAPYVQDGTRLSEKERNLLHESHVKLLRQKGISFEVITGNWEERFRQSVDRIGQLFNLH